MSFNFVAGYGAVSGLTFISFFAASYFTLAVFKRIAPLQSRPLRLSHLFLKLAAPTLALGLLLFSILCALLAALYSSPSSRYGPLGDGALYVSLVANLTLISADIAITLSLYTAAIAKLYAVIHNEKWWKLLRLDAPVGGAVLMILNIAVFGRRVAISVEGSFTYVDTVIQRWFPFIINGTLLLVTVGVLGSVVYSSNKLEKRGELASLFGNIPTLLYVATFVWLLRCSYAWAMDIKTIARDLGSEAELQANIILTPFLECWTAAAMVFLLAKIMRKPVWADASVHPNPIHPAVGGLNGVPQQAGYPKY